MENLTTLQLQDKDRRGAQQVSRTTENWMKKQEARKRPRICTQPNCTQKETMTMNKNTVKATGFNYERIDPQALNRDNYQQSDRYHWLSTIVLGNDAYVLIGNEALKTKAETVQNIEEGENTDDIYLTCDFGNHTDRSYYINTNEGKFTTESESTEPPSWSRHHEEPDMRYE